MQYKFVVVENLRPQTRVVPNVGRGKGGKGEGGKGEWLVNRNVFELMGSDTTEWVFVVDVIRGLKRRTLKYVGHN